MATVDERLGLVDRIRVQKARFIDPRIIITARGGRVFRIKFLEPDLPVADDENRLQMLRMHFTDSIDGHTVIYTSQIDMNLIRDMNETEQIKKMLSLVGREID